jgi:hypothetical protein
VRVDEGRIVWVCPMCSDENPMESQACTTCGTPFGRLFEEPGPPPRVSARGAAALSLVFPGIGHIVARHAADGLARAVVFAFTLTMFVTILGSPSGGPLTPLLILFGMASALVYATTPADAARAVRGEPPILATRVLLIGATGLLAAATLVLVLGGPGLTGG